MQKPLDMFNNEVSAGDLVFYLSTSDRRLGRVYGVAGDMLHMGSIPFSWYANRPRNIYSSHVRKTTCASHKSIIIIENWVHPDIVSDFDKWYEEWQRKNNGKAFK